MPEDGPIGNLPSSSHGKGGDQRARGAASSEWRKAQNRASQKTYREKKKRLLREIHLRALDADIKKHAANQPSRQEHQIDPSSGRTPAHAGESKTQEDRASDLCPAVTIVVQPEPASAKPSIRKVRTVFPFDMSNPYQFRGHQIAWKKKGPDGKDMFVYGEDIEVERNKMEYPEP